jgi:hypothetical protein
LLLLLRILLLRILLLLRIMLRILLLLRILLMLLMRRGDPVPACRARAFLFPPFFPAVLVELVLAWKTGHLPRRTLTRRSTLTKCTVQLLHTDATLCTKPAFFTSKFGPEFQTTALVPHWFVITPLTKRALTRLSFLISQTAHRDAEPIPDDDRLELDQVLHRDLDRRVPLRAVARPVVAAVPHEGFGSLGTLAAQQIQQRAAPDRPGAGEEQCDARDVVLGRLGDPSVARCAGA